MVMPHEWLDIEMDLHSAIMVACDLDQNLARLIATDDESPWPCSARTRSYGRRSTIVTSQIPVEKWYELIGDPTYADAILNRIVHNDGSGSSRRAIPQCR